MASKVERMNIYVLEAEGDATLQINGLSELEFRLECAGETRGCRSFILNILQRAPTVSRRLVCRQ